MAPEQAAGEPIGPRADLFSLGSVLYELCTGRPAFRAATTVAVIRRVCDEKPRRIREVNPDIPEPLCRLIERLQAKKPADRPASAREVADLLAGLLAGLQGQGTTALSAGTPSLPAPRRPKSSRPWLWAAAALVLLSAGLGLGEATGVTDVHGAVIRLFSPDGTLFVEVDDPGVSVTVDGGDVVITGAGAKEIRLKPGQYKVEASKDGKLVRQDLVTVHRNDRQVVRISKEPGPSAGTASAAAAWEKSVATLPPEKQVEAVARRLKELNPGFDGKVTPAIAYARVTGLTFNSDAVEDISPLRALTRLESLDCCGTVEQRGKLADLSPLRGLSLTSLHVLDNPVSDLSPLKGMPLKELCCERALVEDLTPLKGMPLARLRLAQTRVTDLSPLKGMKLIHLGCDSTPVSDLSPLRGMALEKLGASYTRVSDLSPLRGMPLQELLLKAAPVTDLSPLKGMPLKELLIDFQPERDAALLRSLTTLERINDKPAADFWKEQDEVWEKSVAALPAEKQVEAVARRLKELNPAFDGKVRSDIRDGQVTGLTFNTDEVEVLSPVRALQRLEVLDCNSTFPRQAKVSDLTPLRGMRLKRLSLCRTQVADLSPLKGMPLTELICGDTRVSDLSPLKGMRLETLTLQSTAVQDLAPLRGMPLRWLDLCRVRRVSDLSVLEGMPLEYLNLTALPVTDLTLLADMKSLRWLFLDEMPVTDLTPLRGLDLKELAIKGTRITDLAPIKGLPLQKLRLDYQADREEFVRSFKGLEFINDKPAADFWKEVDGQ
jgi:Leucine-rich repeat (LRR) protein